MEEWTRVLISCVIMYVTRGERVKKFEIFMDVIDGSPLRRYYSKSRRTTVDVYDAAPFPAKGNFLRTRRRTRISKEKEKKRKRKIVT